MRFSVLLYGLAAISALTLSGCGNTVDSSSAALEATANSENDVSGVPEDQASRLVEPPISYGMSQSPLKDQHPEDVVREYLEAARSGDPTRVNRLLTALARQKSQELDIALAPPVSENAQFEVLGHEFIDSERTISHVASRWSEKGPDGESQTASIIWVARLETEGWRIAGMIARISDDQPPVPFNFEDPEGILRQQESAAAELARRPE